MARRRTLREIAQEVQDAERPRPERPPRPERVTADDLQARFTARRERRQEVRAQRDPEQRARRSRRIAAGVLAAAALGIAVAAGVTEQGFTKEQAENQTRIDELTAQIAQKQEASQAEGVVDPGQALTATLEHARSDAESVRDAQQDYAVLAHRAGAEDSPRNGGPAEADLEAVENREVLAAFFSTETFLASEEDAAVWQNTLPFDASTQIDPRYPWFIRYDGRSAADPESYTWTVEAVMPVLDDAELTGAQAVDSARVIWVLTDEESSTVLAWASASYSYDAQSESGLFSDLSLVITQAGAEVEHPQIEEG